MPTPVPVTGIPDKAYNTAILVDGNGAELARICLAASLFDETPEGRSIIALARNLGANLDIDGC